MAKAAQYFQHAADKGFTLAQVSQQAFTCSKLAIETLEQGGKYVQS